MIKKAAALVLISYGLAGCVAMTPAEIRATQPEVYESAASIDNTIRCMRTSGADYIQITPYPDSGSVDITVETYQMLKTRILYMATLERLPEGSKVSARFSGQNSISVSESEFRQLLGKCAPAKR